jgi:hypothetical protein
MPPPLKYPLIPGETKEDRRKRLINDARKLRRVEKYEHIRDLEKKSHQRWKEKDPQGVRKSLRERQLRYLYNIDGNTYEKLLQQQQGVCIICRRPNADGRNLSVDHDHKTGKIRGLLCTKCNLGIGHFEYHPALLEVALLYLREYE